MQLKVSKRHAHIPPGLTHRKARNTPFKMVDLPAAMRVVQSGGASGTPAGQTRIRCSTCCKGSMGSGDGYKLGGEGWGVL